MKQEVPASEATSRRLPDSRCYDRERPGLNSGHRSDGARTTGKAAPASAVTLGLGDGDAVRAAVTRMKAAVNRYDTDAVTDDFLVERMVDPPVAEMIVGIRRDPQFGLAMMIGSGGVLVELLADAETLLLPATAEDIKNAIKRLKLASLLGGFRGKPIVDLDALAARLAELGDYMMANSDTIAEIEINPLFVYQHDIRAVDALVHRVKDS